MTNILLQCLLRNPLQATQNIEFLSLPIQDTAW